GRGFLPDETDLLSSRLGSRGSSRQLAPLGGDFSSLLALATAFHVLHPSVEKVRCLGFPLVESFLGIGDDLTTIFLDVLNRGSGCRVDPLNVGLLGVCSFLSDDGLDVFRQARPGAITHDHHVAGNVQARAARILASFVEAVRIDVAEIDERVVERATVNRLVEVARWNGQRRGANGRHHLRNLIAEGADLLAGQTVKSLAVIALAGQVVGIKRLVEESVNAQALHLFLEGLQIGEGIVRNLDGLGRAVEREGGLQDLGVEKLIAVVAWNDGSHVYSAASYQGQQLGVFSKAA